MKLVWWLIDNLYNKSPNFRKNLMHLLYGNKNADVKIFDTEIRINTIRENGYFRASKLCATSSLLRDEISVIMNLISLLDSNEIFIDIGANIGLFSSTISRCKKIIPGLEIYAFEANPETYQRLKINAEKHDFQAVNIALSNMEGELNFLDGAVSHVFTTVENSSRYNLTNKIIQVKCKRLDQFVFPGQPIVLKIDVEGQELNVLEGAKKLFECQRIKAVYLDGFSHQKEVIDFLRSYNFSFLDGRSLLETDGEVFSLLAVSKAIFEQQVQGRLDDFITDHKLISTPRENATS
jgi:FkbM family methyltransferase